MGKVSKGTIVIRTPEMFAGALLAAADFDGTIARTFEPSPHGIGVSEAYEIAIDELFGPSAAQQYLDNGGHHNRAPIEIVKSVIASGSSDELEKQTDRLIETKLKVLLAEIGTQPDGSVWPRPTEGFLNFWEALYQARAEGRQIDSAILSYGHTPFIDKTFRTWGVPSADILVTAEVVRTFVPPLTFEETLKPTPFYMNLARGQWRELYGVSHGEDRQAENQRVVYIGDDEIKDGGLALNSGVDFVLLEADKSEAAWQRIHRHLGLVSVRQVTDYEQTNY